MKCEECENYRATEWQGHPLEECRNFKPKVHPLDEMISELNNQVASPSFEGIKPDLKKLRYESIKWGKRNMLLNDDTNERLKLFGHEDWIVEEAK